MIKAPPPSIYVHVDATWYVLFIIFLFSVSRQKLLEFDLPAGGDYCFCMDRCMYVCLLLLCYPPTSVGPAYLATDRHARELCPFAAAWFRDRLA